MTCPKCHAPLPDPPLVKLRNLVVCPCCCRTVATDDPVRMASAAETLVLSPAEVMQLKKARRKAKG